MDRDPDQEYFSDGIADDIIIELSRIRWLFVIARNSSFTYKVAASRRQRASLANSAFATFWKAVCVAAATGSASLRN